MTEVLPKPWFVYLVRAANGALYCGISDDPQRRFARHQSGKGARGGARQVSRSGRVRTGQKGGAKGDGKDGQKNAQQDAQKGGKTGRHSEHLGYILAEMQSLARQHPGATW